MFQAPSILSIPLGHIYFETYPWIVGLDLRWATAQSMWPFHEKLGIVLQLSWVFLVSWPWRFFFSLLFQCGVCCLCHSQTKLFLSMCGNYVPYFSHNILDTHSCHKSEYSWVLQSIFSNFKKYHIQVRFMWINFHKTFVQTYQILT